MEEEQGQPPQQQHTEEDECHSDSSSGVFRDQIATLIRVFTEIVSLVKKFLRLTEETQQHTEEENECHSDSSSDLHVVRQSYSVPSSDREPTQRTTTKSSRPRNAQASKPLPRVIARPTSAQSGQNGQGEPVMEMSGEDAVCIFCNCILKVRENMIKRKCKCPPRDIPILAHEICTTDNHQVNALCGQCREPFENIPMTLDRVRATRSNEICTIF